jgi:hypothetical protein
MTHVLFENIDIDFSCLIYSTVFGEFIRERSKLQLFLNVMFER